MEEVRASQVPLAFEQLELSQQQVVAAYFSPETLELFDPDGLRELLDCSKSYQEIAQCGQLNESDQPQEEEEPSHLARLFESNPGQEAFCNQLLEVARAALRTDPLAAYRRKEGLTLTLRSMLEAQMDSFVPLTSEEVHEDLWEQVSLSLRHDVVTKDMIRLAEACNDSIDPAATRARLLQLSAYFTEPDKKINAGAINRFFAQITAELAFAEMEENAIIKARLSGDNLLESSRKFHPANQLREQSSAVEKIQRLLGLLVARRSEEFGAIRKKVLLAEKESLVRAAGQAMQGAEELLASFIQLEAEETAYQEFPFSMVTGSNDEKAAQSCQLAAVLAKAVVARTVRPEIERYFQEVVQANEGENPEPMSLPPLESDETNKAREGVNSILGSQCAAILKDSEPLATIAQGRKPRAKTKNPSPQERQAEQTYNKLHREGFDGSEKGLVLAMATGKWPELAQLQAEVRRRFEEVQSFGKQVGCALARSVQETVDAVVNFSLQNAAEAIHAKVGAIGNMAMLKILNEQRQFDNVRAAIRQASESPKNP